MIKLDIAPYCADCLRFCPKTGVSKITDGDAVVSVCIYITCEHSRECKEIEKFIRKELGG